MPQMQFQRVKHKQNPSPESSEEERDTLTQAAKAWTIECLRYEIREIISPASIKQAKGDAGGSRAHRTCGELAA